MVDQGDNKNEDYAVDFLGSYYAKHQKKSGLLIQRLVPAQQGAFADVLVAYQKHDDTFFAASLSLAGSEKLAALLSSYKKKGLGKFRFLTAAVLFSVAALGSYLAGQWIALVLLPVLLALTGFYAHTTLQKRYIHKQLRAAVDELKQLPADHQWLGIRISSLYWRGNSMANYLSKICERKGIGLVTIGKKSGLTLRQEPRLANCRRSDFLAYYVPGETMRKELADQFMRVA